MEDVRCWGVIHYNDSAQLSPQAAKILHVISSVENTGFSEESCPEYTPAIQQVCHWVCILKTKEVKKDLGLLYPTFFPPLWETKGGMLMDQKKVTDKNLQTLLSICTGHNTESSTSQTETEETELPFDALSASYLVGAHFLSA